jgi:hypothetical protein
MTNDRTIPGEERRRAIRTKERITKKEWERTKMWRGQGNERSRGK